MKKYGLNVSYSRVSTDEQNKTGYSIIDQKNETERYANSLGFQIDFSFEDDGYSASNLHRPAVQELIQLVAQNKIRCIVIRHSDRLIRNLLLQRSLQKVFNTYETEVVCINEGWDDSTPEKAFQSDLIGLLNELELKKIRPRTLKGLRGSASSGNYAVGGKPPLGYERHKNEKLGKGSYLVIKQNEAEIVEKIFNTLATNRISVTDMVKYLNKNHLLNKKWNVDNLFSLLNNEIYYGKFSQEWYTEENHTVPIVSKETWNLVQAAIHHKKKATKNFYIFKRVVYCNDCNCYMVLEGSLKKCKHGSKYYKYYKCPQCKKRINETKIESAFLDTYIIHKANVLDGYFINDLKKKIEKKKRRIELLNENFDNNLVEDIYYKEETEKAYLEIKSLNKEILEFTKSDYNDFVSLSDIQKRAIVLSNIEKIEMSFVEDKIRIIYKKEDK